MNYDTTPTAMTPCCAASYAQSRVSEVIAYGYTVSALNSVGNFVHAMDTPTTLGKQFGAILGTSNAISSFTNNVVSSFANVSSIYSISNVFNDMFGEFRQIMESERKRKQESGYESKNRIERRHRNVFLRMIMKVFEDADPQTCVIPSEEKRLCALARVMFYLWLAQRLSVSGNRSVCRHGVDTRTERQRYRDEAAHIRMYGVHSKTMPRNTLAQLIASDTLTPRAPQHSPASGPYMRLAAWRVFSTN